MNTAALPAGDDKRDDAAKKDLESLQGAWVTLKVVSDGKVELDLKEPPKEGLRMTLSYDGHKWTMRQGDKELAAGTSKLAPSRSPRHIDLTHDSGPLKGKTVLGIYKLDGDEYTACIAEPGKPRPTEFTSGKGSGRRLFVCKRQK